MFKNTDASEKGLGAVLYQQQDLGTFRVIAYASQTLSKSERNYDAHKLEFLALKWSVTQRFHEYLYGGTFEVYTNNNLLTYVLTFAKLDAMGQRWIASLANYDFKIFYRSGHLNVDADSLSRIPWDMEQTYDPLDTVLVKSAIIQPRVSIKMPIFSNALVTVNELVIHSDLQLSQSQWRQEQRNDFSLKRLIELCESGKLLNYDTTKEDPANFKNMMRLRSDFFMESGLLYRKASFKASGKQVDQFVMPQQFCK